MSVISGVDKLKKTVAYIFSGKVSDERLTSLSPLGTGFLVAVPHHEVEGKVWPYFVTAKHVLRLDSERYRREIFVRANLRDWSPSGEQLGVGLIDLPVADTEGNLQWVVHSNPAVDIAVIQRFPRADQFDIQAVPTKAFFAQDSFQRARIVEGHELFFPCFTPEIPQRRRNNPVVRFGRIALISDEDLVTPEGNVRFHFVECFPFGGNSGSPVFLRKMERVAESSRIEERYGLFGIMRGHFNVAQPVSIQQTQPHLLARQHMGIAAITPVDYLREILYSDDLRRQRGEIS